LESVGLDINSPLDNIPCPTNSGEHLFLQESPITILYPGANHRVASGGPIELKAEHDNPRVVINWYVDGKNVGQTVGNNVLSVHLEAGNHTLEVVDENDYSSTVTFTVIEA
jgi:membrane carboxypeptidase/penicillin-binding protein PbpC